MTPSTASRRRTSLAGLVLMLLAIAGPAAAHVSLTVTRIPANTRMELAYRAPIERQGTTNTRIESFLPAEFTVHGCTTLPGWTCDVEAANGGTVIVWDAITVGGPNDLRFEFEVTSAKAQGLYRFPTIQTYSDGHEAKWIADDEPNPAPSVTVEAEGTEPIEAPEPTQEPTTAATSEPRPQPSNDPEPSTAPTAEPSAKPSPTASSSEEALLPSPSDEPSAQPTTGASDAPPTEASTDATQDFVLDDAEPTDDADSGPPMLLIGLVILLALGGGAAFVFGRGRTN